MPRTTRWKEVVEKGAASVGVVGNDDHSLRTPSVCGALSA